MQKANVPEPPVSYVFSDEILAVSSTQYSLRSIKKATCYFIKNTIWSVFWVFLCRSWFFYVMALPASWQLTLLRRNFRLCLNASKYSRTHIKWINGNRTMTVQRKFSLIALLFEVKQRFGYKYKPFHASEVLFQFFSFKSLSGGLVSGGHQSWRVICLKVKDPRFFNYKTENEHSNSFA